MGKKQFQEEGGFTDALYRTRDEFPSGTINGVRYKVIYKVDDDTKQKAGLPTYSNTSDLYFRAGDGDEIIQGKLYVNRLMRMDLDWNHPHTNPDCTFFPKGIVHVQEYHNHQKDDFQRKSNEARLLTDAEVEKYGTILLLLNPKIRFR